MDTATTGNAKQSYLERQAVTNTGEDIFIEWAIKEKWNICRLGFDEKNKNVDNFFKLNPLIRNIPDFIVTKKDKIRVINVKGTANIKEKEIKILPKIVEIYSSFDAPLVYAFCFAGRKPIFKKVNEILELWEQGQNQSWHDGVIYRKLNLG